MRNRLAPTAAIRHVWLWALIVGLYSCLAVWKEYSPYSEYADAPGVFEASLSAVIGLLLVFRVNRAYERWWEARSLWGSLVNASRNLAVKYLHAANPSDDERNTFSSHISEFARSLKGHLTCDGTPAVHRPVQIVGKIYREMHQLLDAGRISPQELWLMDAEARVFLNVAGGCEKIRYTLMPTSFAAVVRQCLAVYLILLPWGLVDIFDYWTIPITILVGYFTFAAEGIATYIEKPFGPSEDHLDLDAIVVGIERSVSQILELPAQQSDSVASKTGAQS